MPTSDDGMNHCMLVTLLYSVREDRFGAIKKEVRENPIADSVEGIIAIPEQKDDGLR